MLRATAMAEVGDLFLLDMGKPVRILDLAKRMIRLAGDRLGEDIEIRIIGRRPGEQDHELLTTPWERTEHTLHPSIDRVLGRRCPMSTSRPCWRRSPAPASWMTTTAYDAPCCRASPSRGPAPSRPTHSRPAPDLHVS